MTMQTLPHPNYFEKMIILLVKDPWTFVSILGISMIGIVKWLSEFLNPAITTITLICGAVLLVMGIIEKYLVIKEKWRADKRDRKIH
jgi:uncharacterized membrane protein HdeD (DUF308 family)